MNWVAVCFGLVAGLGTCSCRRTVEISDLHADFRDIWKGYETPETGKEVRPEAKVTLEFSAKPKAELSVGSYYPTEEVASFLPASEPRPTMPRRCGEEVPAVRSSSEPSEASVFSHSFAIGAKRPNAITLAASRPLVKGCVYEFRIPSDVPISDDGARLGKSLAVRFRVGPGYLLSELTDVHFQPVGKSRFRARAGVNTPVAEALLRYQPWIKIAVTDLVPGKPQAASRTFYQQYAHGYRVDAEGYLITTDAGMFRSAEGELAPDVPEPAAPRLDSAAALRIALAYLGVAEPPWNKPPEAELYLRAMRSSNRPPVTRLVWGFQTAAGSGVANLQSMTVDATSGEVVDIPPPPYIQ